MTSRQEKIKSYRTGSSLVALVLIGAGLILVGVMAFFLLPKAGAPKMVNNEAPTAPSAVPMVVNSPAPDLRLVDLDNYPVSLDDYRGTWVLLNNWATWCPPCKAEMPTLQAFHDAHKGQNFTVLAVNMGEPVEKVAQFSNENLLTFPVWPDPDEHLYAAFKNISLPTSWVIDPAGQIRLTWTGAISQEMLEKYVTPLLKE